VLTGLADNGETAGLTDEHLSAYVIRS